MKSINQFIVEGRLTRDAELKYTTTGTALCEISIAYNRSIKRGDQWEDKTCFINGILWGRRAESVSQYLTKGIQVFARGELDFEMWEQDGNKRSRHRMIIEEFNFGQKPGGNGSNYQPTETGTTINENGQQTEEFDEDDIPF